MSHPKYVYHSSLETRVNHIVKDGGDAGDNVPLRECDDGSWCCALHGHRDKECCKAGLGIKLPATIGVEEPLSTILPTSYSSSLFSTIPFSGVSTTSIASTTGPQPAANTPQFQPTNPTSNSTAAQSTTVPAQQTTSGIGPPPRASLAALALVFLACSHLL